MAKTTQSTEDTPITVDALSPQVEPKYMIAEHCVHAIPPVTKIAYRDDAGDLVTRSIPNPCPLVPGGEYTKAEIEALKASA